MLRVPLITLLALLAGCYSPSISSRQYKCGSGGCPDETPICASDGYCYKIGDTADAEGNPADLAVSTDTAVAADMVEPTFWSTMPGPVRGCMNAGWQLSVKPELYACPGRFSDSEFFTLCAPTHSIVRSVAGYDLTRLAGFSRGFFVAFAAGSDENGCSWDAATIKTAKRSIYGLGSQLGVTSLFDSSVRPCGWPRGTKCDYQDNSTDSPFKCPKTTFQSGSADFMNQVVNNNANSGVLCALP